MNALRADVLGVLGAAVVGAALPFLRSWRKDRLHLFVAFGAGVFLGAFFFHLLPDLAATGPAVWAGELMLVGFLGVLVVERGLLRRHARSCPDGCPHRHAIVGWSSFVGLSLHSLTAGLSLGVVVVAPRLGTAIFLAILAHKATAAFSLATIFRLSALRARTAVLLLAAFALMTPLGALAAAPLYARLHGAGLIVPTALAAGTFLYVATMDLLPEAFHEGERRLGPFLALLAGVAVMFLVARAGA